YTGCTVPSALKPPNCSDDGSYTLNISSNGDAYVVHADLCAGTNDWCVDSEGISRNPSAAVGASDTACGS
ncbi:MAG: hypothetical protein U9P70_04195, partial [Patescibacteria group bacterium]|nr:hypothetical protein [Patescibacteria group bacterium]